MRVRTLRFAIVTALGLSASGTALALAPPHADCDYCHIQHGGASDPLLTDASINNTCQSCHFAGTGIKEVDSHNGARHLASNDCTDCHHPHEHEAAYTSTAGRCDDNSNHDGCYLRADINGVTHSTTSPSTLSTGTGANDGICEVCHSSTSYHTSSADDGTTHNDATDCITCHSHNDTGGTYGFKGSGDCTQCHNQVRGTRRDVVDGDFGLGVFATSDTDNLSGHVGRSGDVSMYDCVICHLEGDSSASMSSLHGDGEVNLRNVLNPSGTGWVYNDTDTVVNTPNTVPASDATCQADTVNQRTDLTKFCLSCHNSAGVNSTFIAAVDSYEADAAITRTSLDPFGTGSDLLDVNGQLDVTATLVTHSISCYLDLSGSTPGCNGECAVGTHNDQATGVCTDDDVCSAGTCPGESTCAVVAGLASCECPLNFTGASCDTCAPDYDGGTGYPDCAFYDDCTTAGAGAACANGHGTCVAGGGGGAGEQIVESDESWQVGADSVSIDPSSTHSVQTFGNPNQGASLRSGGASRTAWLMTDVSTVSSSATFEVWVRIRQSGSGGTCQTRIDGTSYNTTANSTHRWYNVASAVTLTAGTHAFDYRDIDSTNYCYFDGLVLTTDTTFDPDTDPTMNTPNAENADFDDVSLDYYDAGGPATDSCECAAGYTGTDCTTCDTGYHVENGDCVADGGGLCASVGCSGYGTCEVFTDPAGDVELGYYAECDCSEQFYGSTASLCDQCDTATTISGTWMKGYEGFTGGGGTGLWTSPWANTKTTECADCHLPADTTSGTTYSNNAHATSGEDWLLDDRDGTDSTWTREANGSTSYYTTSDPSTGARSKSGCFKCHGNYVGSGTPHKSDHWRGNTGYFFGTALSTTCMSCHAGGGTGYIHGIDNQTCEDAACSTSNCSNPTAFNYGANFAYKTGTPGSCESHFDANPPFLTTPNCTSGDASRCGTHS